MKTIITIILSAMMIAIPFSLIAQGKSKMALAKYMPVTEFMEPDSTLGQWYKQYKDTTSGKAQFNDFLKRLSSSEVLMQRGKRAGLTHNQLYSPIVTLTEKNWDDLDKMSNQERATVRLAMLELDIVLAAIESTLPASAYEEFRREVIRGAKPMNEVAKLPMEAVEAMGLTIQQHELSDRINNPTTKKPLPLTPSEITKPTDKPSYYNSW